jgi:hypothetical protein
MDGDLELGQVCSESSVHGLAEPVVLRLGLHHDPEVISKPSRFEGGIRSTAGDLVGSLQPPIHRRERQMTAERREHTAVRNTLRTRSVQQQLEPVHHVRIVAPLCDLRHEEVMPAILARFDTFIPPSTTHSRTP